MVLDLKVSVMKIVIIDGQGGKLGSLLAEKIKEERVKAEIYAVGTNSIATAAMLRAGADFGATGENPVVVNAKNADIIMGPIGILTPDSFLGELTPKMALAIGQSQAKKILIPFNKCRIQVIGMREMSISDFIKEAVMAVKAEIVKA